MVDVKLGNNKTAAAILVYEKRAKEYIVTWTVSDVASVAPNGTPHISIDAHRHVPFPSSLSISITTPVFSAPHAFPATPASPFPDDHTAHSKCPRTEASIGIHLVPIQSPPTRTGPSS